MWHEARKTEKQVFKLFDTSAKKKEIARRIQEQHAREPQESLVIHGHRMRIYDDTDQEFRSSTNLTKWQGDESTLIDRFDVRNFLETIPKKTTRVEDSPKTTEEFIEHIQTEYERYKELVAVEFTGDDEEKVLKNIDDKEQKKMLARLSKYRHKKQSKPTKKAAIGFSYDDSEESQEVNDDSEARKGSFSKPASDSESSDDDEEELFSARLGSIIFSSSDWERLNKIAEKYHLPKDSFDKLYDVDRGDELDTAKINEIERERLSISGRGGKRARARLQIRKKLILKDPLNEDAVVCLKRFADRRMKVDDSSEEGESSAESEFEEKVEFITSFGGEEEVARKSKVKMKAKILTISETHKVDDWNDHKRLAQLKNRRSESPFGESNWSKSISSPKKKEADISLASTRRSRSPRKRSRSHSPKRNKRKKSLSSEEAPKKKTNSGWLHARLKNLKKEKEEEPSKGRKRSSSRSEENSDDCKELEIRSSMSDSEKEKIEIENRKRRIRRTKRLLKKKAQRSESEDSESEKKSAAAQNLRLELQKNLTKTKRELFREEIEKRAQQEEDDKHRNDGNYVSKKYSSRRTPTPNRNRSFSSTSSDDSSRYRRRKQSRSKHSKSRSPTYSRSHNRRRSRSRSRDKDRRRYQRYSNGRR